MGSEKGLRIYCHIEVIKTSINKVVNDQSRNIKLIVTNNFKDTFNSISYTLSQETPRINGTIG